jgi:hypothetical protein
VNVGHLKDNVESLLRNTSVIFYTLTYLPFVVTIST